MNLLFTPAAFQKFSLSNRLVMPPMATAKSDLNGKVTDALCSYYDEKTAGGYIGLVISEHSFISQDGKASASQLSIARDEDIIGLRKLVDTVHRNGSLFFAQLNHAGSSTDETITGCRSIAPSAVKNARPNCPVQTVSEEMSATDFLAVAESFVKAALRAKEAGFDGIELHSAHGYLLNQFFSPLTNKRTDAYGGNVENRVRFHTEIIKAVRETVGEDYPIAVRLGACDYMEGGSTIEDGILASQLLAQAGADLLDISGGFCSYRNPNNTGEGYFRELTEAIKSSVSIPVILTGGVVTANAANDLLENGSADLIGVGRAVLKDSLWAKNASENR